MPDDAIERARRSGFNAGIDHIANFINALDSEGMTARDVRSAIYSECLEVRPGLLAFASQQAPKGWRLVPIELTDAMVKEFLGQRISNSRANRIWSAMLDAAPSVT